MALEGQDAPSKAQIKLDGSASQPDTEYTLPTDVHFVYVTVPAYPLAHDTPLGAKPSMVVVPAALPKL